MLQRNTGRANADGQVVSGDVPYRSVSKMGQGEARQLCKPYNLTLTPHNALHSVSPVFSLHVEDTALKAFFLSVYRRVRREPITTQTFSTTHLEGGQEFR